MSGAISVPTVPTNGFQVGTGQPIDEKACTDRPDCTDLGCQSKARREGALGELLGRMRQRRTLISGPTTRHVHTHPKSTFLSAPPLQLAIGTVGTVGTDYDLNKLEEPKGRYGLSVQSGQVVELEATSSPAIEPTDPWTAGVTRLQEQHPLPGFSTTRWRQLCLDCAALLERHGPDMHRLGWLATDAFGVHPTRPADAIHCAGLAVLLNGSEVTSVSATGATIRSRGGATQSFTRIPMPGAVPVWEAER